LETIKKPTILKDLLRSVTSIVLFCFLVASTVFGQNEVTYGLIQNPDDPKEIVAAAYTNYSSDNVTISTAVFSLTMPVGTLTEPAILEAPADGAFNDINGQWVVELLTPDLLASVGFDPNVLENRDVYQVILDNAPTFTSDNPIEAGTPIPLFYFRIPDGCVGETIEVLTNDGSLQKNMIMTLGANPNNQMSMTVDDEKSTDIYAGNNPETFAVDCSSTVNEPCVAIVDNLPNPLPGGTYQAADEVITNTTILSGETVTITAGQTITLQPGFIAEAGSDAHLYITPCEEVVAANIDSSTVVDKAEPKKQDADQEISNVGLSTESANSGTLDIKVFPNPFDDLLRLQVTASEPFAPDAQIQVQLLSLAGQLLQELTWSPGSVTRAEGTLQLYRIPSGTYLIKIITEDQSETIRVQKL